MVAMFAPDVNILIGFNYKEHKFHPKIAEFFNLKEYKELLILGSVKQNFQYKISRWNTNAISFLICTINKIRSEQPAIDDIVVFNDAVLKEMNDIIEEMSKTYNDVDKERIREIIDKILGKYTISDLMTEKAKQAIEEYTTVKIIRQDYEELNRKIKEYFVPVERETERNEEIRDMIKKHFAGKRDPYDDELIAEDLILNKQRIKRLKMFLTADRDFSDTLNKIFESEKIQGIKSQFLFAS